jgi:hypothetical protein
MPRTGVWQGAPVRRVCGDFEDADLTLITIRPNPTTREGARKWVERTVQSPDEMR